MSIDLSLDGSQRQTLPQRMEKSDTLVILHMLFTCCSGLGVGVQDEYGSKSPTFAFKYMGTLSISPKT